MRRMTRMTVTMAFLAASTCVFAQTTPDKRLNATGSGSLEQITELWRDGYRALAPGFELDLRPEGSSAAPKALTAGTTQFALMSREMKPEELAAFQAKMGYPPTRIAVAMDALVILVNKNNPIKELKVEQLDAIYSTTLFQGWPKAITLWGELGWATGSWSSRPIVCWGRPAGSGTRAFFEEVVMMGGKGRGDIKSAQEESGLNEELIANQAAIGYGAMSDVYSSLKAVPVQPKGGKTAIPPTVENVASGGYPLSRFLFIYINKAPGKPLPVHVAGFLEFALSGEGQKLLTNSGQVPLPDELLKLNRRRLR